MVWSIISGMEFTFFFDLPKSKQCFYKIFMHVDKIPKNFDLPKVVGLPKGVDLPNLMSISNS